MITGITAIAYQQQGGGGRGREKPIMHGRGFRMLTGGREVTIPKCQRAIYI